MMLLVFVGRKILLNRRCLAVTRPQPRPVKCAFYRYSDSGSTILYSSYCATPPGKGTFVIGEWWNEVNDRDRYTLGQITIYTTVSILATSVFFTSSCYPAWRGSVRDECYRRLSEVKNGEKAGAEHIQDVDHVEFESDGFPDRVPGDSTRLSHTSVMQDFLSTDKRMTDQPHPNFPLAEEDETYSYRTKPPNTARPPYNEIASEIARPRIPRGRAIGARELNATTVTPARRGPPIYRYLSFFAVAPT